MTVEHQRELPKDERIPPVEDLIAAIEREGFQTEATWLQLFEPWIQLQVVLRSHRLVAHEDHVGPPAAANDG